MRSVRCNRPKAETPPLERPNAPPGMPEGGERVGGVKGGEGGGRGGRLNRFERVRKGGKEIEGVLEDVHSMIDI